ncbi:MAG: hypothetical protein JKY67_09070 [Pseudomonadales bacterium]|nr:hypothetical protein [Pseudomonadales bacterium]
MRTVIHRLRLRLAALIIVAGIVACTVLTACGNKNELYYASPLPEAQAPAAPQVSLEEGKTPKKEVQNKQ